MNAVRLNNIAGTNISFHSYDNDKSTLLHTYKYYKPFSAGTCNHVSGGGKIRYISIGYIEHE